VTSSHTFSTQTPRHVTDGIERVRTDRSQDCDELTNDDGELSPGQAKRGVRKCWRISAYRATRQDMKCLSQCNMFPMSSYQLLNCMSRKQHQFNNSLTVSILACNPYSMKDVQTYMKHGDVRQYQCTSIPSSAVHNTKVVK
jgi:hypothetical protein